MEQMELLRTWDHEAPSIPKNWKPDVPPDLTNIPLLAVDAETTGKDKWKDKPFGLAVSLPDGRDFFITEGWERWAKNELNKKVIINLNIGFDCEQCFNAGIDLEQQGNFLVDVGHYAALLNEYRYGGFSLDALGKEYAGRGKTDCPVPAGKLHLTHPSIVAPYAKSDSRLALDIYNIQRPKIKAESLDTVANLESDLIYVVNYMERNGAPIDLIKLDRWRKEIRAEITQRTYDLHMMTGCKVNPSSEKDMRKLFAQLGLNYVDNQADTLRQVNHPAVKICLRIKQLQSLLSKYFDKYWELSKNTGLLRYALHQLRSDDEFGSGGTITGRFSSSGGKDGFGINCQQVMKPSKQRKRIGPDYIVRELFVPGQDADWFSSDASQIEFRLFGHYAQNKKMLEAYKHDPWTDFYDYVRNMLATTAGYNISRDDSKVLNLATIYGQGKDKRQRGLGVDEQTREKIDEAYNLAFPEAKRLLRDASNTAERRGYVKTILGRRGRFDESHDKYYTALNKVLQGTAADLNKLKLRALYRSRHQLEILLRLTVHDEADGDSYNPDKRKMLEEFQNEQLIDLRVPILWSTGFGKNWKEAGD